MNENIFSSQELNWLQKHPKINDGINESIEDSLNANPLDLCEPYLIPYKRAVEAAHITIEVTEKKLFRALTMMFIGKSFVDILIAIFA